MAGKEKRAQSPVEAAVVRHLRGKRAEQQVTVTDLAAQVNLSREQLSRILNGKAPASFSEMVDIASALGVDLAAVVAAAQRDVAYSAPTNGDDEPRHHPDIPLAAEVDAIEARRELGDYAVGDGADGGSRSDTETTK